MEVIYANCFIQIVQESGTIQQHTVASEKDICNRSMQEHNPKCQLIVIG